MTAANYKVEKLRQDKNYLSIKFSFRPGTNLEVRYLSASGGYS
jgi:hypothetical protein